MKQMHSPHDKLFKETFSHIEVTADFLTHYVPQDIARHIDIASLQLQKDSFIENELAEYYSDLLFSVSIDGHDGYLYFLFEHKSYHDRYVALQLLRYMVEIWKMKVDKEQAENLPIILPVVFYQGKDKWAKVKTISELIDNEQSIIQPLHRYIPEFEILFYNFSQYGKIDSKVTAKLKAYLQLMKHLHGEDKEQLYWIIIQLEQAGEIEYFKTVVLYLLHVSNSFSVDKVKERLTVEGRKEIMTIAEQLRREGRREGEKESTIRIAKRMIELNKTDEEIMELTDLTKREIKDLRK